MEPNRVYPGWEKDLIARMRQAFISVDISYQRMERINSGYYDSVEPAVVWDIPAIDGQSIIQFTPDIKVTFDAREAQRRIEVLVPGIDLSLYGEKRKGRITLDYCGLQRLGVALAPVIGYGFLNGGSASSYIDISKNQQAYGKLFDIYRNYFDTIAACAKDRAKGITPAYINPDGALGEDFFALKIRAILIKVLTYLKQNKIADGSGLYRMFQMDSVLNREQIRSALREYTRSPLLRDLIEATGVDITHIYTASQPLLATFTCERPVQVFEEAYGEKGRLLPMPGGHGQNFEVLKEIYRKLLDEGKYFVYLGNIDNMGNVIEDASIAYLALSGREAAFEFTARTDADIKGGIAVIGQDGHLNCVELGIAVSVQQVQEAEKAGRKALFNAATGIFDLRYLVPRLDHIIEKLPMRLSIQNKEAGRYLQTEQSTWEVISLMDAPLILVVDKYERFLPSKILIEGLMQSSLELDHPEFPENLRLIARKLCAALPKKLRTDYGMKMVQGRWIPKTIEELIPGSSSY